MNAILKAAIVFVVGCMILAIVIYVASLVIALLTLPPAVTQIAMICIGLLGLLFLIYLCVNVFNRTPPGPLG